MNLNSAKASSVLRNPSLINKSRFRIHSSLLPYSHSGPSISTSDLMIPRKKPGRLDDVRSNSWLDAMKSSSPPSKKVQKEADIEDYIDDAKVIYSSWMVLEVRPVIDWDKGKAVEFLLESLGFRNIHDVLPNYIGDDRTDEDAFKVLRERYQGYGILVSTSPKESNAIFSLRDTSEAKEFLEFLAQTTENQEI